MTVPPAEEVVTVRVFVQRLSSTRRGARLARRLAVHQLDAWGVSYDSEASQAVTLVVAELAANAVLHGRVPGRDFELRMVHDVSAARLRVELSDTHPALPRPERRGPLDEAGRGLRLVEVLARRWGVRERQGPGKTVWAEIDLPGGARQTPPEPGVRSRVRPSARTGSPGSPRP
ncbi:ATP-binding protein [Streptomyces abyssomicinicus]|uniref:ATP-binding protein n=1 Tax=Streptomyces abyssomicinicus TaxID=574929 RepID=UPI0012502844|nr:ATP-binding protein [Streptomyces abyssomicinicus]